jgi:hypothetical protein
MVTPVTLLASVDLLEEASLPSLNVLRTIPRSPCDCVCVYYDFQQFP